MALIMMTEQAGVFIKRYANLLKQHGIEWDVPHVANDFELVVFEWWRNEKVLTFFIGDQVDYLVAWGPHIWDEMNTGAAPTDAELLDLWGWLHDPTVRRYEAKP